MTRQARVLLTFDAEHPNRPHADPAVAAGLLDALAAAKIRASFFVQGRWAGAYPALARRIVADGHVLGSHGHAHERLPRLSEEGLKKNVLQAERCLTEITGVSPKPWFRCPHGDGSEDPRVLSVLGVLGYRDVNWDVDPKDWCEDSSVDDIVEAVTASLLAGPNIVLMHTWPSTTLVAVPRIIESLNAAGASFGTIEELA